MRRWILGPLMLAISGLSATAPALAQTTPTSVLTAAIAVNQLGYTPHGHKRALLLNSPQPTLPVLVLDAHSQIELARLTPGVVRKAGHGIAVQQVEFSALNTSGEYLLVQGALRSSRFRIEVLPYATLMKSALRSYYLQRCNTAIHDPVSGLRHPVCHPLDGRIARDDGINRQGQAWPANGGWHDAGDYGKYIATAAVTVSRLLSLYEAAPDRFDALRLDIPESANAVPDLLDEARFELEWMLNMQRQDGAVYRKLSGAQWPKEVMPHQDDQVRLVYGVSSPDTGKFAATLAQAARVYAGFDPVFSVRCLQAATRAWTWLQGSKGVGGAKDIPTVKDQTIDYYPADDGGSGSYLASGIDREPSLATDQDDRLAAASELYLTTASPDYLGYLQRNIPRADYTLFEWKDMSSLGLWHLLQRSSGEPLQAARAHIRKKLLARAERALRTAGGNAYGLADTQFVWGSNKLIAEEGINLVYAYWLTADTKYLRAATHQLDYLLGVNPFAMAYVTGFGQRSVQHPNHIPMRNSDAKLAGLMVGGPSVHGEDGITPKNVGALSYIDHPQAYASNEYAIDYNAALIGLIEALSRSQPPAADGQPSKEP